MSASALGKYKHIITRAAVVMITELHQFRAMQVLSVLPCWWLSSWKAAAWSCLLNCSCWAPSPEGSACSQFHAAGVPGDYSWHPESPRQSGCI